MGDRAIRKLKGLMKLCRVAVAGRDNEFLPVQTVDFEGRTGNSMPLYPYGMHALAAEDALSVMLAIHANPEERVHIPTSAVGRPTLAAAGELVLYNPVTGSKVYFKASGDIEINAGSANVTVIADTMTLSGDLSVAGDLDVTGSTTLGATVTSNSKDISDTHTHIGSATAPAGSVSPTGIPN